MDVNGVSRYNRQSGIPGQNTAAPGTGGNQAEFHKLLQDSAKVGLNFSKNVPNNMVVTTMSQNDMRERVFTNIDSAVLM